MVIEPKSNICVLNTWDFDVFIHDEISFACDNMHNGTIIINSITEYQYPNLDHNSLQKIDDVLEKRNNKMIIIYCSHQYWEGVYKNIDIIETPTSLLKISNFPEHFEKHKIQYPFSMLVNRPHEHRCRFIDKIYEKNINEYFNFSWNILSEEYLGYQYPFRYYKEKIHKFDDEYASGKNWIEPSNKYFESFLDVVLESTIDCKFYTEKTSRPIYYQKLFIIFGSKGINHGLLDFGFELYDEIIDYSFDYEDNIEKRIELLTNQLEKIIKTNFEQTLIMLRPKIQHNYENLLKIQSGNHHTFDSCSKIFEQINLNNLKSKLTNLDNFVKMIDDIG